jgi:hypothetical protein
MKKPASLREFLTSNINGLGREPDSLLVFIDKGSVVSTLTPSLSFEYRYKLNLVLTDYNGHADTIMVPLLVWIRTNQPDLLEQGAEGIQFEAELLNNDSADISITLDLTERVLVKIVNGQRQITHLDEPPSPDLTGPIGWEMYANGNSVAN